MLLTKFVRTDALLEGSVPAPFFIMIINLHQIAQKKYFYAFLQKKGTIKVLALKCTNV